MILRLAPVVLVALACFGCRAQTPRRAVPELPASDEVCNGRDDDGDGDVDEGFGDLDADGVADCIDDACTLGDGPGGDPPPPACSVVLDDPWDVTVRNVWHGLDDDPDSTWVSEVMVAQVTDDNGDGQVDALDDIDVVLAVFQTFHPLNPETWDGHVVAVDAATGVQHWAVPGADMAASIAVADLDGGGTVEVVFYRSDGQLQALAGADGETLWVTSTGRDTIGVRLYVADLKGDGLPEVLTSGAAFDGRDGSMLWDAAFDDVKSWEHPIGDVDLDGDQEHLATWTLLDADGQVVWDRYDADWRAWHHDPQNYPYATFTEMIDADDDPEGEILIVATNRLVIHDTDGEILVDRSHGGPGNPPCVDDFDGDGVAEIAFSNHGHLTLVELDGTLGWSADLNYFGGTGVTCAGFDFDRDGASEIVVSAHDALVVFSGVTGDVVFRYDDPPGAAWVSSFPKIVDLDGDGSAEILWGTRGTLAGRAGGLQVLEQADGLWPDTGRSWPTYDFNGHNVAPDGQVASPTDPRWLSYNSAHAQPAVSVPAPDLRLELLDSCASGCAPGGVVRAHGVVHNLGTTDESVTVQLVADDGSGERVLADEGPLDLDAGTSSAPVAFEVAVEDLESGALHMRISASVDCEPGDDGVWIAVACGGLPLGGPPRARLPPPHVVGPLGVGAAGRPFQLSLPVEVGAAW